MTKEESHRYCDDDTKCKNKGADCDHCTRSYDYEESGDYFIKEP